MTTFFTILFIFFLLALCVLGATIYKVYASLRKVRDTFGFGGSGKHDRSRDRRNAARQRHRTDEPVIPREYAVDVQYTEEAITGTESFLDTSSGRAENFRTETQVSDAEYVVISDK